MPAKKRLSEFDVMRSFAIFIILFHHLPAYCFNYYNLKNFGINYDLSYINDLNRYFGLGIFIYISGFLLQYSSHGFNNSKDVYMFLWKRIVRIIPLYIIALIMFIKLFGAISISSFFIHILGLQVILSSKYCDPVITLWYVGLIISYYLIFICIKKYGTNTKKTVLLITLIPIIAIVIKGGLNFIDKRFFTYYMVFIVGVYSSIYYNKILRNYTIVAATIVFFISSYIYVAHISPIIFGSDIRPPLFSSTSLNALFLLNFIMISFAWITHYLSMKINIFLKSFELISYLSYCMYLFHRPVWGIMLKIYEPQNAMLRGIYLAVLGIPTLLICSFYLQKGYDNLLVSLSKKQ